MMKAIGIFPSSRAVRLIDHPAPAFARPDDVMLKMIDIGVCGTDKEICAFQYGTPPAGSEYLILGHESLGEVVDVSKGVARVKPGDLVIPTVRRPCPRFIITSNPLFSSSGCAVVCITIPTLAR